MKYQIQAIDDNADGKTKLLIKDGVFRELAIIPWKQGQKTTLNLHPTNIAALPNPVDSVLAPAPQAQMPVFTDAELQEVLTNIVGNTKKIQSQNRKTLTPLKPPP